MSIKLCGHEVRFEKPIKVYTFFKHSAMTLVLSAVFITPSFAADTSVFKKLSPGNGQPSEAAPLALMEPSAGEADGKRPPIQRNAGTSSVSAMALILALGLRNVHGPLEHGTSPPLQRQGGNR